MTIKVIKLSKDLREEVLRRSAALREHLERLGLIAVEFLGGPGSGKTTIIECLVKFLTSELRELWPNEIIYIGGDVATTADVERLSRLGVQVVQVNTGGICHLEVEHVFKALSVVDTTKAKLVLIENVGNLVCPFFAPLGVHAKVLVLDAAAGPDKPLKYPHAVRGSNVIVVNKIDLVPENIVSSLANNVRIVNSSAKLVYMVAVRCKGVHELYKALAEFVPLRG